MAPETPTGRAERLARAARAALNDPAVMEALRLVDESAFESFKGSGLMETREREIAYLRTVAVAEVRAMLENWVREGKTE